MKKLYRTATVIFALFILPQAYAQNQANIWYFGEKFGLNFNTVPPTVLTNGSNTSSSGEGEGTSSICDANGQLLLYSDGINIYRGNGTSILAVNSNYNISQNIFVPDPGNTSRYYFIHPWAVNTTTNDVQGIKYTILSATSSTNGAVVSSNQTLTTAGVTQGLTVIPDNGNGYWLVSHSTGNNNFIVWHLTSGGFSAPATYSVGFSAPASTAIVSMMKTNSCFNQIAVSYFNSGVVQVVDFNNSTGAITKVLHDLDNAKIASTFESNQTYGVEFSPNGKVLYVTLNGEGTSGAGCRFYQFDLTVGTVGGSRFTLDATAPTVGTDPRRYGAVQLGPDNNVYMTQHGNWGGNGGAVAVVNNPDVFGAGAGYVKNAYQNTNAAISSWPAEGLPPVLRSFLAGKAKVGSTDVSNLTSVCFGTPITFKVDFNNSITGYNWNIDANLNNTIDYTIASPVHNYSTTGNFLVNVTVTDFCGYKYTDTSTVKVIPMLTVSGAVSCTSSPATVTLSGLGAGKSNYIWMDPNKSIVGNGALVVKSYATATVIPAFFTVFDATTTASAITAGPTNYAGTGDYDASGGNTGTFSVFQNTVLDGISVRKAANFTDGSVNPRPGSITILKGSTIIATTTVNIATNQSTGAISNFTNLGLYVPAGAGYTISITSFSSAYNPTNTPVNNSLASVSGAASPFFNYTFRQISQCQSIVTVTGICVLPVKFVNVVSKAYGASIEISWTTLREDNNKLFTIERSQDGIHFIAIGQMVGAGNSTSVKNYSFEDKKAPAGILYYRIKQTDYDGNATFSNITSPERSENVTASLYPNPFTNDISLRVVSATPLVGEIKIYNVHGALILQKAVSFDDTITLGSELSSGFYSLEVISEGYSGTIKIIKQ